MAFQVSPGVNVSEIDLTTVVPATSTTEGAVVGVFRWGPTNEKILVSSENDLVQRFGKPHSALTQAVTPGTFETVVFDAFVLPTAGTDTGDTFTLDIDNGIDVFTVTGEFADNAELASALNNEIINSNENRYRVSTNGNGDIQLVWQSEGAQPLVTTYDLSYAGAGTGGANDGDPTKTVGTSGTISTAQWSNVETFYTAADFLSYSNALYVVRVSDGAKANGSAVAALADVVAKYPGELGNSLKVEVIIPTEYDVNGEYTGTATTARFFDYAPDTNELHIAVIDNDGAISGIAGTVLEKYTSLSTISGSKTVNGANNYAPDVLEQSSQYITATSAVNLSTASATLSGGTDGSDEATITMGELQIGWDEFKNAEEVEVSFLMQGKARDAHALGSYIIGIAESRRDCVACVSPAYTDVVNNKGGELAAIKTFSGALQRSTYAIVDSGYKYRYDKHGDSYVYTPLNGDIAGLCARTDDQRDPWFSPAGLQRGLIKNVVKLAYNPSKADRDVLYSRNVNPVITQAGQGTLLFGDKTFSNRPSAFDRINVRRLFIVLEKSIARASRSSLFEFNDEFTRAQFRNLVEPFLRDVQGRRGIYDFKVVCDGTNNTSGVIDRNEFVGDIYIKPARSINFIQLNFVAVSTGVEFNEVVGGQV